ncbi:MAG: hypothetical protein LBG17_02405, partial [Bacteroidales bacterium]|nr:hypothetical protein [Bacteroidales bacterium]
MKKFTCLLVMLAIMAGIVPAGVWGQTAVTLETPYMESFTGSSLPNGWANVSGNSKTWAMSSNRLYCPYGSGNSYITAPVLDLSGLGSYKVLLEFDHYEQLHRNGTNTLVVYYQTSAGSERVKLGEYQSQTSSMVHQVIELPAEAKISNFILVFHNIGSTGTYATYVDNVAVHGIAPIPVTFNNSYTENFDGLLNNALPSNWENHTVSGSLVWRTQGNSLYMPNGRADYADVSYVTSPMLDLSAIAGHKAIMEFDHFVEDYEEGVSERLIVGYKVGFDGEPVKLDTFANEKGDFKRTVIELPEGAKVSNLVLYFEGQSNDGMGISVDNLSVYGVADNDILVKSITSPDTAIITSGEVPVTVSFANNGTDNITSANFTLEIDGNIMTTETAGDLNLAQDGNSDFTFVTKGNFPVAGTHTIRVWSNLTDDRNPYNDTVIKTVAVYFGVDAIASAIVSPLSVLADASTAVPVQVRVTSNGRSGNITDIKLTLEVDNIVIATENVNNWNLPYTEDSIYTFTAAADLSAGGNHKIRVWVDVTGEEARISDTVEMSLINYLCPFDLSAGNLVEDFETPLIPCWNVVLHSTNPEANVGIYNLGANAKSGSNVFGFFYNSGYLSDQYLITRKLSTEAGKYKRIRFYHKRSDASVTKGLRIGYSTTANSPDDLIWVGEIPDADISTAWQLGTYDQIPAEAAYIAIGFSVGSSYTTYIYMDSLVVENYDPPAQRAEILSSVNPKGRITLTAVENISVSFKNTGLNVITDMDFSYQIDDGAVVTEKATGLNVAPLTVSSYTFTANVSFPEVKTYNIKAWLTLDGDPDNSDDTVTGSVTGTDCIAYPHRESFENLTTLNSCWNVVSMNTNNAISIRASNAASYVESNDGSNSLEFSSNSYSSARDHRQYIMTPGLPQTSKARVLSFYYTNHPNYTDGLLYVGYSTTTNDLSSFVWDNPVNEGAYNGWKRYIKTGIDTDVKYIAILFNPGARSYAYIDNLTISEIDPVDAVASSLVYPYLSMEDATATTPVKVRVTNNGLNNITGTNLTLEVDNIVVATETVTGWNLPYAEDSIYTFTVTADLSAVGAHKIRFWTDIADDANSSNDTAEFSLMNFTCGSALNIGYNLVEDFEYPLISCWKDTAKNVNQSNKDMLGIYNIGTKNAKSGSNVFR